MLEKIKEFYRPEIEGTHAFTLNTGVNKKHLGFGDTRTFYLTFGVPTKNAEEAIENGAYVTTPQELGKLLFPQEWEKGIKQYVLPDERTKLYLGETKESIGLVKSIVESEGDGLKFNEEEIMDIWVNANEVRIGKDEEGNWIAEYSLRTDIDAYVMFSYSYNSKPTEKMIMTTRLLDDIEIYFGINGWDKHTFNCWECGNRVHWLDAEGDLQEKWDKFIDKYCGC
jgi:hypothetical protein